MKSSAHGRRVATTFWVARVAREMKVKEVGEAGGGCGCVVVVVVVVVAP